MHIVKQMLNFLPVQFLNAIEKINQKYLYEIRIRVNQPTMVRIREEYVYLADYGATNRREDAIIATKEDIEETVLAAGKYSVYSIEDQLRQGFITAEGGARIGIAGKFIFEKGVAVTVRDFSSLCIRIPHEVIGCGGEIYEKCLSKVIKNLLIVSPPGQGKTTILRDLSRLLCQKTQKNVLICDERGEISNGNVGAYADVYSFADKKTALMMGVRVMRPDIIITDELTEEDIPYVRRAKASGVKVIASYHSNDFQQIPSVCRECFDEIALLDCQKIGKLFAVYQGIRIE